MELETLLGRKRNTSMAFVIPSLAFLGILAIGYSTYMVLDHVQMRPASLMAYQESLNSITPRRTNHQQRILAESDFNTARSFHAHAHTSILDESTSEEVLPVENEEVIPQDLWGTSGYLPGNASLEAPTPEGLEYECGGVDASNTCFEASQACLSSAESIVSNLYLVDPVSATQSRTNHVCKCFVSNGCSPSCNVAIYTQWSSRSGINCPSSPPVYDSDTGVYQYGDPKADYIAPSDLSFDYYPNFPNPAGHTYDMAWSRDVYEDDPGAGFYQIPLQVRFRQGVRRLALPSVTSGLWVGEDPASLSPQDVYCGSVDTPGCGQAAAIEPPP